MRVLDALVIRFKVPREGGRSIVPRVSRSHCEERDESVREVFKVDIVIHVPVTFDLPKVDHSKDRIHVHKEEQETSNVRQLLHRDDKGVKN